MQSSPSASELCSCIARGWVCMTELTVKSTDGSRRRFSIV